MLPSTDSANRFQGWHVYTGWPQAERSDYRVELLVEFRRRGGPGSPIVSGCRWTWACLAEKRCPSARGSCVLHLTRVRAYRVGMRVQLGASAPRANRGFLGGFMAGCAGRASVGTFAWLARVRKTTFMEGSASPGRSEGAEHASGVELNA